jgi:hypothetical protein
MMRPAMEASFLVPGTFGDFWLLFICPSYRRRSWLEIRHEIHKGLIRFFVQHPLPRRRQGSRDGITPSSSPSRRTWRRRSPHQKLRRVSQHDQVVSL